MANQITINPSLFSKLDLMEDELDNEVEEVLTELASTAVNFSPVDTGAYVTSFSIVKGGSGGGRGRSSENKPKNQNPENMRAIAFSQLMSDIAKLDLKSLVKATLRNRSPHSNAVEDGGPNWRRAGYGVFKKIRNIYG